MMLVFAVKADDLFAGINALGIGLKPQLHAAVEEVDIVHDGLTHHFSGSLGGLHRVQVQNTAQVDNLLHLAHSSFDSKNYSQAEAFCNQVIAIDGANYEAWKLKGEAINYQITGKNDRITEVYNCIMTSYNVLDEDGQDEHREEVLESLRICLEGEIDFVLKLFRQYVTQFHQDTTSYLQSMLIKHQQFHIVYTR